MDRCAFTRLLRHLASAIAITVGITAVYFPVAAGGAKPPSNTSGQFTISAQPNPVLFWRTVTITGRLKKPSGAGNALTLQHNPYPFAGYLDLSTTSTASDGGYTFTAVPEVNTRYRVVTTTLSPQKATGEATVLVRPRVSLRVSDRTPARGQRVRFSGTVTPSHDGRILRIQRRSSTGAWVTVARTILRDAGDARSTYARSLRIWRDGVFRTLLASHSDHTTGTSGWRHLNVP